jgi:sec-independent protein translocase protein TatB
MEIFNIHIFEFLLIAGLGLVVFGPERLPEVGRFLGQQVAKFLAWQQNSPELQMLNEVRGEFEREIAELRDELVRTRQQLDISRDVSSLKDELRPMLDLKSGVTTPAATNGAAPPDAPALPPATTAAEAARDAAEAARDAAEVVPEPPLSVRPAGQTVPAAAQPNRLALAEPTSALGAPGPSAGDQPTEELIDARAEYLRSRRDALADEAEPDPSLEPPVAPTAPEPDQLLLRVQALAAELQALTAELQERGVLRPGWQAPERAHAQETMPR